MRRVTAEMIEVMKPTNLTRVERMLNNGLTVREIAMVLQVPIFTVQHYVDVLEAAKKNKEAEKES